MSLAQARYNMIEQQIRPWHVLEPTVLDLLDTTPRELFVPQEHEALAYTDTDLPLGHNEEMMPPRVEARMIQALDIQPTDNILEVGTGSGYVTALLAKSGQHVTSVDIIPEFTEIAAERLQKQAINNVTLETGDAATDWDTNAPYDIIAITGSLPLYPHAYADRLKIGGRLFAVIGDAPVMTVILITRTGENEWTREDLFETELKPLTNAPQPKSRFKF